MRRRLLTQILPNYIPNDICAIQYYHSYDAISERLAPNFVDVRTDPDFYKTLYQSKTGQPLVDVISVGFGDIPRREIIKYKNGEEGLRIKMGIIQYKDYSTEEWYVFFPKSQLSKIWNVISVPDVKMTYTTYFMDFATKHYITNQTREQYADNKSDNYSNKYGVATGHFYNFICPSSIEPEYEVISTIK